jgi:hypothetical protein
MALGATCCLPPRHRQYACVARLPTLLQAANTPPSPCLTQDASMCVPKRSRREARRVHVRLPGYTPPSPSIQLTRLHDPACGTGWARHETCDCKRDMSNVTACGTRFGETCASSVTHVHLRRHMCICVPLPDMCTSLPDTCASPTPR